MSEKSAKAARVAAPVPPPLLASPPIPLPAAFAGDFAGATVIYDLERVLDLPYCDQAALLADLAPARAALAARLAALDPETPDPAATRALEAEARALVAAGRCRLLAWCGWRLTGADGGVLPWAACPPVVLQWLCGPGLEAAVAAAAAPFLPSGSPA